MKKKMGKYIGIDSKKKKKKPVSWGACRYLKNRAKCVEDSLEKTFPGSSETVKFRD